MMKVAHRIITSLVVPREDKSTISSLELYDTAHLDDNLIPHYGLFVCNKLTHLSTSQSRKIYYSGVVSMFTKSALVWAPYPENHQPLPGEPYLTTTVLESMRMFWSKNINHNWIVGQNHNPNLLIPPDNWNILSLKCPTNFTDWQITLYLFPVSPSGKEDEEGEESEGDNDVDDEGGEEEPQNISPTSGASSSHGATHPSYHQQYKDQLKSIHTRLDIYHHDLTHLT
ncbi:unnamed protein product [Lactuca saligna]|uniref:Uncharacterized protein n=1 Tax=Lactuca saligna TaxID=75948 RepID=A0AA35VRC2_LACSI|nr:unnamed protein product [Lactuca saligna]